ncbi:MAG: MOSC domain-containing protein [Acidimicrobiales bacterium]
MDTRSGAVVSVNVGSARSIDAKSGQTGIEKLPVAGTVEVREPTGDDLSGLVGDRICDVQAHGGRYQAVYAYASEDYWWWAENYDIEARPGFFGENVTTEGLNLTEAEIGESWKIGSDLELSVTSPRIPCSTFQVWIGRSGWIKTFRKECRPGAYLKVVHGGLIGKGDPVVVTTRPGHGVTIGLMFRALTTDASLLGRLEPAFDYLDPAVRQHILGSRR